MQQYSGQAATAQPRAERFVVQASVDQLLWLAALYWTLAANKPFFGAALKNHDLWTPGTWGYAAAVALGVVALHVLVLGAFVNRWTVKPVLSVVVVVTAFASHFIEAYGIYLDPSMLRNVLRTDPAEAGELLSWGLSAHLLLYAAMPLALLWRVRVSATPWKRARMRRRSKACKSRRSWRITSSLQLCSRKF